MWNEVIKKMISTFGHIFIFLLPSNGRLCLNAGIAQLVRALDSYPPRRTAVEDKKIFAGIAQLVRALDS
jgi:hypothetical protein